jgi:hypothetical protein
VSTSSPTTARTPRPHVRVGVLGAAHSDRDGVDPVDVGRARLARRSIVDGRRRVDNAVSEAFFSTLEHEVLSRHHFATRAQARAVVTAWCHDFYNVQRRHSSAGRARGDRCHPAGGSLKEASTLPGETQTTRRATGFGGALLSERSAPDHLRRTRSPTAGG